MQKQIYVSFFIITIFIFIIVGCGSDSNNSMITPSSDNQEEQNYGSLSITVVWPQEEIKGNLKLASGDTKENLIASMPARTRWVHIEVVEEAIPVHILGELDFERTNSDDSFATQYIERLPVTKVKVIATFYALLPGNTQEPIATPIEKVIQIKIGNNSVGMDLGRERIKMSAIPAYIALSPDISSSMMVEPTAIPELTGKTQIVAKLVLESDDIPNQPPPPTYLPREDSNIESQGEWGLENYEVKFTIIDGIGELIPVGSTDPEEEVTDYTTEYGNAVVFLRTDTPGIITVQASCQLDPDDPESVITATCNVEAITSTSVEDAIYQMKLTQTHDTIIYKEFSSPDIPTYPWSREGNLTALLEVINFDTGEVEPAPGQQIDWTIDGGSYFGGINSFSSNTVSDGTSNAGINIPEGYPTPVHTEIVTVEAKFTHPYKSDNILVEQGDITIISKGALSDDFEKYDPGTRAYDLQQWGPSSSTAWVAGGTASETSADGDLCYIDSDGGGGTLQSIMLYSSSASSYATLSRHMGYWDIGSGVLNISNEVRFYIKMGDDVLNKATVNLFGIGADTYSTRIPIITFNNEMHSILDSEGHQISGITYSPGIWYEVRVQMLSENKAVPERAKINYWIGTPTTPGEFVHTVMIENLRKAYDDRIVGIEVSGGTVWFDEFDQFTLPKIDI